jgi:hypothetical protein
MGLICDLRAHFFVKLAQKGRETIHHSAKGQNPGETERGASPSFWGAKLDPGRASDKIRLLIFRQYFIKKTPGLMAEGFSMFYDYKLQNQLSY